MDPIFVYRSDDLPRAPQRGGYFFDGADLYADADGFEVYEAIKGPVPSDLDGIYHTATRGRGGLLIGGDRNSFIPLFFYETKGFWAISNSFARLLDLIRARGEAVTLVPDVLQAWRAASNMFQRPGCWQTAVAQIRLLPSYCDYICTPRGVTPVLRDRRAQVDYAAGLSAFQTLWSARAMTILTAGRTLQLDVTGGNDTRACLAALWAGLGAARMRRLNAEGRLLLTCRARQYQDQSIAWMLCRRLGLRLTTLPSAPTTAEAHPADATTPRIGRGLRAFEQWRDHSLGLHGAVNPQGPAAKTAQFHASGVMGAALKSQFWAEEDPDNAIRRMRFLHRHRFESAALYDDWLGRVAADVDTTTRDTGSDLPFSAIFSREFSQRFHAQGHINNRKIFPLGFGVLQDAVDGAEVIQLYQFKAHHDLVRNAGDAFVDHPYDVWTKEPREGLDPTDLPPPAKAKAGRAVVPDLPPVDLVSERTYRNQQCALLQEAFAQAKTALTDPAVQQALGPDHCRREPRKWLRRRAVALRNHLSSDGAALHAALLAAEISGSQQASETAQAGSDRQVGLHGL